MGGVFTAETVEGYGEKIDRDYIRGLQQAQLAVMNGQAASFGTGAAEEPVEKKAKGTSNMFMFKIRAFEDVLKLRGKHIPVLQPRSFNYLANYNDENEPAGQHKSKPKNVEAKKQPLSADKTHDDDGDNTKQDVNAKYREARQLCHDQLTVLEETKSLLERELERNRQLELTVTESEGKITQLGEKSVELQKALEDKESEVRELRDVLDETSTLCRAETKRRMQVEDQIKELKAEAVAAEGDIELLKKSMEFYRIELMKVAGEDSERQKSNQQRLHELEQVNIMLEQHKQEQSWRISELAAELQSSANLHGLQLEQTKREHEMEIRHVQELAAAAISELRRELYRLTDETERIEMGTTTADDPPVEVSEASTCTTEQVDFGSQIQSPKEANNILSEELQLMKSVVQRQKQIIQRRDEDSTQQAQHYDTSIASLQMVLLSEQQKNSTLERVIANNRSSILQSLNSSRHQLEREKGLFDDVLSENTTLKKKLLELKEQLRSTRSE